MAKAHGECLEMARSYLSLLQAFQKEQEDDRSEDEELPGRGIVEDILGQLEEGELHTEQLSEVVFFGSRRTRASARVAQCPN